MVVRGPGAQRVVGGARKKDLGSTSSHASTFLIGSGNKMQSGKFHVSDLDCDPQLRIK